MPEYISREEAIKELREVYENEYPTASGDFDEYASHDVPNVLRNIPAADVQPVEWISVKDRLPDIEEGTVLVWIDDGIADDIRICDCLHIAYWYGDEKIFCDLKDSVIKGITHWMYTSALPEPPKDGDTND